MGDSLMDWKWNSYSHPISDIRDWNNAKRLEIKPDFQRNEVWIELFVKWRDARQLRFGVYE